MQQRRLVSEEARQQVEAVCANASLSAAQNREEIRQIRERERHPMEALITPAQQKHCDPVRKAAPTAAFHNLALRPCGELENPKRPLPEGEENEQPPKEEPQPN